jgi:hypothetical protein
MKGGESCPDRGGRMPPVHTRKHGPECPKSPRRSAGRRARVDTRAPRPGVEVQGKRLPALRLPSFHAARPRRDKQQGRFRMRRRAQSATHANKIGAMEVFVTVGSADVIARSAQRDEAISLNVTEIASFRSQ